MSTVNQLLLIAFLTAVGCTQKKDIAVHGMSSAPTTQYSYMGAAERILKLKFDVSKSRFNNKATLKAIVSLPFDYNSPLEYKWKLGEKVVLKSGELTGSVSALVKNIPIEISIDIDNFDSRQNRFVRFEIIGSDPNRRIFTDGIISSHQENSFESVVQELEKINANK